METRLVTFSVAALSRIAASEACFFSTKSTATAPRDNASKPSAPDPAKRSSTRAAGIDCCKMLNQASRTRSDVGLTLLVAGVLRRRPLNSPAIMRSKTRHSSLNRRASLPIVSFKPERDIERVRQPVLRHHIGPAESDRGQDARPVVQRKPQVIRPHAPRADRARIAHTEHRRRIPRPARLEMPNQLFQFSAHFGERQLEIDALARRQVLGGEKLARHAEECNAESVEPVAPDREAGRHRVAAVLLEMSTDFVKGTVEIKPGNAAPRAAAQLARFIPPDQERRPAVALHEPRGDDPDDPLMPRLGAESWHQG